MKRRAILLVMSVLISLAIGCTTTSVPEQAKAQIKRVALVSLFPSELDIHQIGVLPVLHDSRMEQVREWDVYDKTLAIADQLLRAHGYDPVIIDARSSLVPLPALPDPQNAVASFVPLAREKGADAIVIVAPNRMTSNGPDFYSVYFAPSKLFGIKSVFGGCVTTIHVFSKDGVLLARSIDNGSFKEMKGISWHEDWSGYSAAERKAIYTQLEKFVEENLQWKISKIL